jgi:hypothetical protein
MMRALAGVIARVEDHVTGGHAAPAVALRAPASAFADRVVALLQQLGPTRVEDGKTADLALHPGRDTLFDSTALPESSVFNRWKPGMNDWEIDSIALVI